MTTSWVLLVIEKDAQLCGVTKTEDIFV